nr:MAG TPA: hypothetical protein [Caudoviricetes sp.]DAM47011.1 MAG TPA: hypothetical protein [Caudoviricetes sp.]
MSYLYGFWRFANAYKYSTSKEHSWGTKELSS